MYVVPTTGITWPSLRRKSRDTDSRGAARSRRSSLTQKPVVVDRGCQATSGSETLTW